MTNLIIGIGAVTLLIAGFVWSAIEDKKAEDVLYKMGKERRLKNETD